MNKTIYTTKLQNDLDYGNNAELSLQKQFENHFECKLNQTHSTHLFDFINEEKKIILELKTRRNTKKKYSTTMVGYNKIQEAQRLKQDGWRIYFVFYFTDDVCFYEFDTIHNDWVKNGGRRDRGRLEYKQYYYIPVNLLHTISF
jgi:hypothetical protein